MLLLLLFCIVKIICNNYTCLHMIYEMKSMRLMVSLVVSKISELGLLYAEPSENINDTADNSL